MNRLDSIRTNLPSTADLPLDSSYEFCWQLRDDLAYVLQRLESYEKGLKEISRYTHSDYPFKGEALISEIHTLINLALKEE